MDTAPKLDPRTFDDIVADTEVLATAFSPWRARTDATPDFGGVLVRLFGRMMEHLVVQLNQIPNKHRLAFTNLLGATRIAPRAARAPVTFTLPPGDGTAEVPEAAQIAATTPDGTITFETESVLELTRAQLQAVFVRDVAATAPDGTPLNAPDNQRYADRTRNAQGALFGSFDALAAGQPRSESDDPDNHAVEHELYIAVGDPLRFHGAASVNVVVTTSSGTAPTVAWSAWDNQQQRWIAFSGASVPPGSIQATTVNGKQGNWLRGTVSPAAPSTRIQLGATFSVGSTQQQKQPPDVSFFNAQRLDLSRDFRPFGDRPRAGDACYFSCDEAFGLDNAAITIDVSLSNPMPAANSIKLKWERWSATGWTDLGAVDSTNGLLTSGKVSFTLSSHIPLSPVNGIDGRWIRVRIDSGDYGHDVKVTTTGTPPVVSVSDATFAPPVLAFAEISWIATVPIAADVVRRTAATYSDPRDASGTLAPYVGAPEEEYQSAPDTVSTLHLGFDRAFEAQRMTLYVEVASPPSPDPAKYTDEPAPLTPLTATWEYARLDPSGKNEWAPLAVEDGTASFARSGLVRFDPPTDMAPLQQFGQELFWLRARPATSAAFAPMPQLLRISTNTVWASHRHTIRLEILGSSNGARGQTVRLAQTPILEGREIEIGEPEAPAPAELLKLQAEEGADVVTSETDAARVTTYWVRWHEVADFWASGARDRHYVLDATTGAVTFGDGIRGMIPPTGTQNIRAALYRSGGGPTGNVAAATITQIKTTIPGVASVTNTEPAIGGAAIESEAAMADRASRTLRHGYRAVTAQDYVDLALEASNAVARAAALTPSFSPIDQSGGPLSGPKDLHRDGEVIVVIVPALAAPGRSPSVDLLSEVQDYLRARCATGARLNVVGPSWIGTDIEATIASTSPDDIDAARARVHAAIAQLLDPITGGDGAGWAFGRKPRASDVIAAITAVPGVDHVSYLKITSDPPFDQNDTQSEISIDALSLYNRLLVYARSIKVTAAHPKPKQVVTVSLPKPVKKAL